MTQLQQFTDMTGTLSKAEINTQNLNNIVSELNRTSDQLDSLNQTLNIVAYGTLTYSWDGTGSGATPLQSVLQTGVQSSGNFIGMSYLSRDVDSPTLYVNLPYFRSMVNANGDAVLDKLFIPQVNSASGIYQIVLNFYAPGTPIKYTFYYFIFQQPSSISQ